MIFLFMLNTRNKYSLFMLPQENDYSYVVDISFNGADSCFKLIDIYTWVII